MRRHRDQLVSDRIERLAIHRGLCRSRSLPAHVRLPQPREHLLVLRQDHIPPVVPSDVVRGRCRPSAARSRGSAISSLRHSHELVAVGVVEPGVALAAVVDQHFAPGVREDRRADGERLQRQKRQALVRRRDDDDRRGFERLQPLLVRQPAGEPDERLLGQRHQLHAHQHQRRVAALLHVAC